MRRFRFIAMLVLILASAAGCTHSKTPTGKRLLRWKFHAGEKFSVHIVQASSTTFKSDASRQSTKDELVIDELLRVESVDSHGTAKIAMAIERVRMKSPDEEIDTASTSTEKTPTDAAIKIELVKRLIHDISVHFTIDDRGRVLRAKMNEDAIKAWGPMIPGWSDRLSEKGIMEMLRQLLPVLPDSPLAVGDTWNDAMALNRADFRNARVKYRYTGPTQYKNATVEKIVTEATLDWNKERIPKEVTVKVVSQENPGVVYFDNAAGRLVEIRNTQKRMTEFSKEGRTVQEIFDAVSIIEVNSGTNPASTPPMRPARQR